MGNSHSTIFPIINTHTLTSPALHSHQCLCPNYKTLILDQQELFLVFFFSHILQHRNIWSCHFKAIWKILLDFKAACCSTFVLVDSWDLKAVKSSPFQEGGNSGLKRLQVVRSEGEQPPRVVSAGWSSIIFAALLRSALSGIKSNLSYRKIEHSTGEDEGRKLRQRS